MAVKRRTNTRRTIANVDLGQFKLQGMALAKARGTNLTELLKELLADRIDRMLHSTRNPELLKRYKAALRSLRNLEG